MTWPLLRRVERQARRLSEVLKRLGIDEVRLARLRRGRTYADARRRCLECPHERRCGAWLAAVDQRTGEPEFCPNAGLLRMLRRD